MRNQFVFFIGIIIFIAFVWLVTTIGFNSSLKKDEKPVVSICCEHKFEGTFYI